MRKDLLIKAKELFDEVLNLNSEERKKILNDKCGNDSELKKEVLSLIHSYENTNDFLEEPLTINKNIAESFKDPYIGKQVGNYLIEGEAGIGGMGIVYSGKRNDNEFEQKAAIKILKYGITSEYLLKRFQIERQTLANLQHEYIARLLDGGRTDDGLPYLVMEFIDGIPITEYCKKNNLNIKKRLELFIKVCNAVQYAHQNLVIHRDIKPGNILVTQDTKPKLLDFGIAKLMDEDLSEGLTRTGVWHLTPEYSSPEQIKGEKITTASDIYSLGVMLYEILSGVQPYRITSSSPVAISRVITEENILKPSDKVKDARENSSNYNKYQNVNAEKISHQLKGDLDNIVLKAMHKEPERRYASVEQFAEDIKRHLKGLPVIAQKDTAGYRLSKFIQRHKIGFASSVAFILFLIASIIAIAWQANVASDERDKAELELTKFEEINNFLLEMLSSADPGVNSKDVKVYDLLEKATVDADIKLKEYPKIKSAIKQTLGSTFIGLGEYEKAEKLLLESFEMNKVLFGLNSKETAKSAHQLGLCYDWIGNYEKADSFYNLGISVYEGLSEEPVKDLADNLNDYGTYITTLGHYDSASVLFSRALEIYGMYNKENGRREASTINNLAVNLHHQKKVDEAEKYYLEAQEIFNRLYGPHIPELSSIHNNLAFIYLDNKNFKAAESEFKKANEVKKIVYGLDHPSLGLGYINLGMMYLSNQEFDKAVEPLMEGINLFLRTGAVKDPTLALGYYWLGCVYLESGKLDESEKELNKSLKIREEVFPENNFRIWSTRGELAVCYLKQKRYSEAEKLLISSLEFHLNDKFKDMKKITRYTEYAALLYKETGNKTKAEYYKDEYAKLTNESSSTQ